MIETTEETKNSKETVTQKDSTTETTMGSGSLREEAGIDVSAIRAFMMKFRSDARIFIPDENIDELTEIMSIHMKVALNFKKNNPLSTMETLTLALSLLSAPKQIAEVLMSTQNTVETYIKRARHKLGVESKSYAIFESMRRGYFKILN